jgi:serine/threonine protein kinase
MYILLCGEPPFNGANPKEVFRKVIKIDYSFNQQIWGQISSEAKDLIRMILVKSPAKRISIQDAMNHPWFKFVRTAKARKNTLMVRTLTNLAQYKA